MSAGIKVTRFRCKASLYESSKSSTKYASSASFKQSKASFEIRKSPWDWRISFNSRPKGARGIILFSGRCCNIRISLSNGVSRGTELVAGLLGGWTSWSRLFCCCCFCGWFCFLDLVLWFCCFCGGWRAVLRDVRDVSG